MTSKQVRWQEAALEDLVQIVDHIAQDAPLAAERFATDIFAKTDLLADTPYLGAICSSYRKARQLIHKNYIIYYTVHRRDVVIRAIVHGARLFRSSWLRREHEG
jgi:plasmid stabilization system protein ParE